MVTTIITAANSEEAGPLIQELASSGKLNHVSWTHCTYHEPSRLLMAEGEAEEWSYRLYVMNADLRYVAEDDERRAVCHLAAIIAVLKFGDYRDICGVLRTPATYRTFVCDN
ncbi:hypothetical protein PV379_02275 [Streptomyces caniscabiei]|uniref:hypothetical protein n=1 Tax=Streptomyces caniscabiei TaxID=2746961 RepID=UPI0029A23877|nr:hypothetical protein [Streptomyces caniscabiei]MDX2776180.1 hypothetical protein [Streptomyces caniscabiei]